MKQLMKLRIQCISLLLLAINLQLSAQEKLVEKGNEKYQAYSFSPAIDIYQKVLDKGYESADLLEKLGNAYYFSADYEKAATVYKRLIENYEAEVEPEFYFRFGQALKSLGEYDQSDTMLARFADLTASDARAARIKNERDYREEIAANSGRYELGTFEFNSAYADFAPAYYKKGLLFSSDRDTGNLAKYRHSWTAKDFLDLYKVNADSISEQKVVKLDGVNSRLHESTSVLTKDGKTMYFTRNNIVDGKPTRDAEKMVRLRIFRAKFEDGRWASIEDLPFNNDSYSVAHPALSPDEKTLYFASDMPGTLGMSDLFKVSIKDDGTFSQPENLGVNINTEARETFPFITEGEILYFSSDGHPGLGGLDVFASKIKRQDFNGVVLNVGTPVNSNTDDFSFIMDENTRTGYFASNRDGGLGGDDIYSFEETRPLVFECVQPLSGTVRDKISNEVLVGATVRVIDEENEEVRSAVTDSDGHYELSCDCNQGNFVRASMQGYVPAEEYLGVSDGKPRIIDFYLERETISGGFGDDLAKLLQLSTIYFDFDKYTIRPDAELEIQKIIAAMEKYPSLKIKANSHTDSRGPDSYNLWLSQKRAEATVNYMIAKGISPDRLQGEGFGESRLVNRCANGVQCTQEEHELNRRSEFIITE